MSLASSILVCNDTAASGFRYEEFSVNFMKISFDFFLHCIDLLFPVALNAIAFCGGGKLITVLTNALEWTSFFCNIVICL
jgi:hypothetical protein